MAVYTTPSTPPALRDYRSRHTIRPVKDWSDDWKRYEMVCLIDGIRVYEVGGRLVHDSAEIKQLAAIERGEKIDWTIR